MLAFELPDGVKEPRLLITDTDPITRVLIGHEGSLGHKKICFALSESRKAQLPVPVTCS